jgi:hypothetical protein
MYMFKSSKNNDKPRKKCKTIKITKTDGQTNKKQTDRKTGRQTGRQIDRQTDK